MNERGGPREEGRPQGLAARLDRRGSYPRPLTQRQFWPEDYDQAISHAQRLKLMTVSGDATDRCQCPTCWEVFSTEGNFNQHLTPGRLAEDFAGDWCRDPAGVGLVKDARIWHRPGPEAPIARSTAMVGAVSGGDAGG